MSDSSKTSSFSAAQKRVFKIIVVGDSCVGKTCLTYRFCEGKFPVKTEATIGVDFREKTLAVDGESIKLQLWDTAGQERFRRSMVHHYYRNVHAVVFVYDVTSNASFEALPQWIEECDDHKLTVLIPRILVGINLIARRIRLSTPTEHKCLQICIICHYSKLQPKMTAKETMLNPSSLHWLTN